MNIIKKNNKKLKNREQIKNEIMKILGTHLLFSNFVLEIPIFPFPSPNRQT